METAVHFDAYHGIKCRYTRVKKNARTFPCGVSLLSE